MVRCGALISLYILCARSLSFSPPPSPCDSLPLFRAAGFYFMGFCLSIFSFFYSDSLSYVFVLVHFQFSLIECCFLFREEIVVTHRFVSSHFKEKKSIQKIEIYRTHINLVCVIEHCKTIEVKFKWQIDNRCFPTEIEQKKHNNRVRKDPRRQSQGNITKQDRTKGYRLQEEMY